ncbi:hypothetical protein ACIRU2_29920 [Streptomyces sp. NPDC101169]|uniref:hypothetical protein n=1 Tax=Streptomyces sp. NPDC101169 TaxID=3366121 RepID=UPI0037FCB474
MCGSAAVRSSVDLDEASALVRIEVSDAAAARRPPSAPPSSAPEGGSGRGLLLVDAPAARWGWTPRHPVGKTVWAEVGVPAGAGDAARARVGR